ncbi:hypothetical protein E1H12_03335 [Geitlerinema sp. P-1104]|uniref:DUF7682 family zinc-binding protein n=1 Tax=Geitlerinema sp. P-1104 TaxID=2546230 RepID=UPI001477372C|nr:hypothetical protein [Geitlerinema sp. P-1104]NMG57581.1 hypothetical protein [Geitlerinema sp. P-1104]
MAKRRKKTFPCGHKGYGKTCHRCAQERREQEKQLQAFHKKKAEKEAWEASFEQDEIDLRSLPQYVVVKARDIISGLAEHQSYRDFNGKRMRHDRQVISIPITRNYRMICHDDGDWVIPQSVLSHEDYNVKKPGA